MRLLKGPAAPIPVDALLSSLSPLHSATSVPFQLGSGGTFCKRRSEAAVILPSVQALYSLPPCSADPPRPWGSVEERGVHLRILVQVLSGFPYSCSDRIRGSVFCLRFCFYCSCLRYILPLQTSKPVDEGRKNGLRSSSDKKKTSKARTVMGRREKMACAL